MCPYVEILWSRPLTPDMNKIFLDKLRVRENVSISLFIQYFSPLSASLWIRPRLSNIYEFFSVIDEKTTSSCSDTNRKVYIWVSSLYPSINVSKADNLILHFNIVHFRTWLSVKCEFWNAKRIRVWKKILEHFKKMDKYLASSL